MRKHYIIQSYGTDENYWLGRFVCLPLDAQSKDETVRVSFNYGADVQIYFHPEILDYVLVIDDADLLPPYKDFTL